MSIAAEPAPAAALAAFGVLLVVFGLWLRAQASLGAAALAVAQARGQFAPEIFHRRRAQEAVRHGLGQLAALLGPLARPLGSSTVRDRLAWLGSEELPEQFLARQVLMAGAGLAIGVALPVLGGYGTAAVLLGPLAAALLWWLPVQDLEARCRAVRRSLGREALGWADFLTAAVQAGLPLEGAIERLAAELPGRLPQMVARAVRESSLTAEPLDLCLAAAAAEIDEPHVASVLGAIVQARQTGGDLAGPLQGLVGALRQERQQQLRTAARGRSTLGSLPLIFVMLPGVMLPLAYVVFAQFRGIGF